MNPEIAARSLRHLQPPPKFPNVPTPKPMSVVESPAKESEVDRLLKGVTRLLSEGADLRAVYGVLFLS